MEMIIEKWSPIETAPRDEKAILVCEVKPAMGVRYYESVCCAIWMSEAPLFDSRGQPRAAHSVGNWAGVSGWLNISTASSCFPTHWMPMPNPPETDPESS